MKFIKKIYKLIKIKLNKIGAKKRKEKLIREDFTIISNNCYAGLKYENLSLAFNSPTIGLYFYAPEYLKFIKNLKYYCSRELKFIDPHESKYYEELKRRNQLSKIIGKIDDVEIVFLHYNSVEEAKEKWEKRCKRINYDFIIYKFNDQNLCTYKELKEFYESKLDNKICFTAKKYDEFDSFIQIKKYKNEKFVKDDSFFNNKYLNIIDYINNICRKKMQSPIRILHVLNKMHMGGAETLVMNLYKKIDKQKFQFDFIVNHPGEYDDEIKKMGGKIYYFPEYKFFNHLEYIKVWKKFLNSHPEYLIIHGHVRSIASIYLKIAKKKGIMTICHSHSTSNGNNISSILKSILQYRIRYIADFFLGCSKEANEWLFGKKVANSSKCLVLNNAINIEKFLFNHENREKIRKLYNITENKILIGHVGRFVEIKNHKFLINLFYKLYQKNKDYVLMLVGDGILKDSIKNKIIEMGIQDSVIFVNPTFNINEYYSAFDYFVLPSKTEGLGIVLIEAQAAGIKCFASDTIPKNVNISKKINFIELDENRWINEIKDAKQFQNRIVDLKQFDSYNINIQIHKLEDIYYNLLK